MNNYLTKEITNDEIQKLPLQAFEGKIHIIETEEECNHVASLLHKESTLLGFDTETKPTFHRGDYNDTALVQLSTMKDAYLFRLNKMGCPQSLFDLFENPSILKLGISIVDDLKALKRLKKYEPASFIDLNDIANDLGVKHIGMKKLAAIFLGYRISKSQQTSNWEKAKLTAAQQLYAATDASICLTIYQTIKN